MSEQEPKPTSVKITRKRAVIGAGLTLLTGVAAFLLGRNPNQNPEIPQSATTVPPTPTAPKPTEETPVSFEGSPFQAERIRGVDVFGYPDGLSSRDDIKRLNSFLDQQFTRGKTIKADPNNRHETRLELMPKNQRNLQLFISDKLFSQFESSGGKDELVRRLNLHVQVMNQILSNLYPKVDLQVVLKRVVVVKEQLLKGIDYTEDLYPLDIDGRWDIKAGEFSNIEQGAYVEKTIIDGKEESIDYGLIHEWFHALFSYPDEYTQNYDGSPQIPALYIEKSAGIKDMSYWVGYFLKEVAKRNIRGIYTDPRSFKGRGLLSNQPADLQSANAILGMRPKNVSLQFTNGGKPVNVSLQVEKEMTSTDYYTGKKYVTDVSVLNPQRDGLISLPDTIFTPSKSLSVIGGQQVRRIEHTLHPQGWLLKMVSTEGKPLPSLHLPAMAINMAGLAGAAENIGLIINFSGAYDSTKRKQVIKVHGPKESSVKPGYFAHMAVSGTTIVFYWYQE